jgi:thiol-disulfide isomerase/thioredoxin
MGGIDGAFQGNLVVVVFPIMDCSRGLGPCHMVAPEFENLPQEYPCIIFVKMYIDAPFQGRILINCGIHMPIFQFFRDGKEVDELELRLQGSKTFPILSAKVRLVFNKHKPADVEDEAVCLVVAPVRVRALCSHKGCTSQLRAGGLCSRHGAQQNSCSMEGYKRQAQKEGVCVTHGATTKRCGQEGCSKQVVRGGKCNSHGQSERLETFWGQCSKSPVKNFHFYDRMKMVDGDLVCGRYPCMSHSGKGVRCIAKGCMKYVRPMKGENR